MRILCAILVVSVFTMGFPGPVAWIAWYAFIRPLLWTLMTLCRSAVTVEQEHLRRTGPDGPIFPRPFL